MYTGSELNTRYGRRLCEGHEMAPIMRSPRFAQHWRTSRQWHPVRGTRRAAEILFLDEGPFRT